MEGSVYNNLGTKINRTFKEKRDENLPLLVDHLSHKTTIASEEELKKIFRHELNLILQKENIFDLIEAFFNLENNLSLVLDTVDFEFKGFDFDEFYKNLSPLFMRSLLENAQNATDSKKILSSLKESLRIALEEEFYNH